MFQPTLLLLRKVLSGGAVLLVAGASAFAQDTTAEWIAGQPSIARLLEHGVYGEAARRLEAHLENNPDDIHARRLAARAYLEIEEYYRLRQQAEALLRLLPDDPEAMKWNELAREKIEKEFPAALAELERALEREPDNIVLRRRLIELQTARGEADEAIRQFQLLLAEDPENPELIRDYARNLSWLERYDESLEAYRQYLEMTEADPAVQMEVARVLAWNGQFGAAATELRDFLKLHPDNLDAQVLLGDIYRWNDDTHSAAELYRSTLEANPRHPGALAGLEELEAMAERRLYQAQRLSIPAMEERIATDPEDWDARLQLARLYGAAGRYDDAAKEFALYLEGNPEDVPIIREYAFALSMEEAYDEAILQLRGYLEKFPEDLSVRLRIADMLMWQADFDQARVELAEIAELAPGLPETHWHLARIHHMHEEWNEALENYRKVREIDPNFEVVDARIRQIENHPRYRLMRLEERIAANPNDILARMELADMLFELDRYFEARDQALAVLDFDATNEGALRIIRWTDEKIERLRAERALELRELLRADATDMDAILELARLLKAEEAHAEAVVYFQRYLQANPGDREARREYAQLLSWLPQYRREAARELQELLVFFPGDIALRTQYLEVMSWLQDYGDVEKEQQRQLEREIRALLETDPNNVEAHTYMARLYQISENWNAALAHYRAIIALAPFDREAQERVAEIRTLPEFLIAEQREKIRLDPRNFELRMELAEMLFEFERYPEAREEARIILRIDANNRQALRLVRYADDLIQRQRGEEIRDLRAIVRADPRNYDAQLDLGRLLMAEGDYAEAIRRFQIYLRAYPDNFAARRQYTDMLSWLDDSREEAIKEYRELLAFYPDDDDLRLQFARVLTWEPAHWAEAERELKDILTLDPGNLEAMVLLGHVNRYQGRYRAARQLYEAVLASVPPSEVEVTEVVRFSTTPRLPQGKASPAAFSETVIISGELDPALLGGRPPFPGRGYEEPLPPPRFAQREAPRSASPLPISSRADWDTSVPGTTPWDFTETAPPQPAFPAPRAEVPGVDTTVSDLEDFRTQALEGILAIDRLLDPRVNLLIAYTADNETFAEFQAGARYTHFFRDGSSLYIGFVYYNFQQSGAPISMINAGVISVGASARLADRLVASGELSFNAYDAGINPSVNGFIRGSYEVNPFNTAYLEFRHYDIIYEVKTIESLEQGITANRVRIGWDSTPPPRVQHKPFFERFFFEGYLSYAGLSDGNSQTSVLIRPYYRILDNPALDLMAGWRSFSYARESPFYWSPQSYQGPTLGLRVMGQRHFI